MGIKLLDTSIPNNERIAAIKKKDKYKKNQNKTNYMYKSYYNIFGTHFEIQKLRIHLNFYSKINSCAMGTICATAYSNIFMSAFG